MKKISVVISAYNEEKKIKECLKSVSWADELIVVDNSSSDATPTIAKNNGAKVITRENNPMLNINKNFGFSKATGDWILSLDTDERVTKELMEEIKSKIQNSTSKITGYWIPRKNIIFGRWIQSDMWWPDYQLRLFKKGKGKFPQKHVHEYLMVEGDTEKLTQAFVHENYTSVSQYLSKLDTYTNSEVENLVQNGKKVTWTDAISFPTNDFLKIFFAQRGYKDGLHGLVLSLLQAFYMEVVFVKMWERQDFMEQNDSSFLQKVFKEFKRTALEYRYWFLTSISRETKNPLKKIFYKALRRFTNYA